MIESLMEGERFPGKQGWQGNFQPFVVGEAGVAAERVVSKLAAASPHQRDIVIDGVTLCDQDAEPALHLRAASIRGLSHRHYGKVRQDDYAFRATEDGRWLVIAVADGVSAGENSHMAAEIVVVEGCQQLADMLAVTSPEQVDWAGLLHDLSNRILDRGQSELARAGSAVTDLSDRDVARTMATTALFAVIGLATEGSDNVRPVYSLAHGDTGAWLLSPSEEVPWRPLGQVKAVDGSGVVSSSTFALPLIPEAIAPAVVTALRPGHALVLMTDGIGDPLGSGTGEVGQFLAAEWATPPAPLEFAAQLDFARKSYDDDRTAVVVWASPDFQQLSSNGIGRE